MRMRTSLPAALFKLAMFTVGGLANCSRRSGRMQILMRSAHTAMTKAGERQFVYLNDAALAVLVALAAPRRQSVHHRGCG